VLGRLEIEPAEHRFDPPLSQAQTNLTLPQPTSLIRDQHETSQEERQMHPHQLAVTPAAVPQAYPQIYPETRLEAQLISLSGVDQLWDRIRNRQANLKLDNTNTINI
jgi:hypothetical protein